MRVEITFQLTLPVSIEEQAKDIDRNFWYEGNEKSNQIFIARGWIADMLCEAFNSPSINLQTMGYYYGTEDAPRQLVEAIRAMSADPELKDECQVRIVDIKEATEELL